MADAASEIEAEALKLTAKERARIAERLLASLHQDAEENVSELWQAEAEKRLDELLSGAVQAVPADHVWKRARSSLR